MKYLSTLLVLFLITAPVFSQTDTIAIADRIAAMDFSKPDIISKSRRLLHQDFLDGNKEEVARTLRYLTTEIDDEYHLSLWDYERYLLMYWLGDYANILLVMELAAEDTGMETYQRPSVYPSRDILGQTLRREIKDRYYDEIIEDYASLLFTQDTNDFLYMFLNRLLGTFSTDELNRLSDNFVKNYPYSPLTEASKKFISYKFALGDYGLGMTFGGGAHFATGQITDWITQPGGLCMDLTFYYKRIQLAFSIVSSFGEMKQDLLTFDNRNWYEGEQAHVNKFSIQSGFRVFEYKRLNVTPFAGISFNEIAYPYDPEKDDPSFKNLNLGKSVSPVVGLDMSFRLNKIEPYTCGPLMFPAYTLGLRAAYYPNVVAKTHTGDMRGQTWFAGIYLGVNFSSLKRVY